MRLIILLLMSSFVLASDLGIGSTMEQMIQNPSFRFMLVFMLFFLLLYAIFLASIAKVSVFKGKGSLPSKQGKVVALSLGLMGAFGVSYWANYSSAEFVTRVLSVAGWFGAIAVAFLAGAVAWKSKFGNWGYPTLVAGIAFLTYGVLIGNDWAIGLGNILIVAGIIGLIFWVFSSDGSGSGNNANNSNQGGGNQGGGNQGGGNQGGNNGGGNGNNGNGNNGGNGNDGGDGGSQRPPGPMPPPTPPSRKTDDPPMPPRAPSAGVLPPKEPIEPLPKLPNIPDDKSLKIDLSPKFLPIRSQDSIGACSAFAATSIFEYILIQNQVMNREYLSPLYLYYHTREMLNDVNNDNGAPLDTPLHVLKKKGVCLEKIWMFQPKSSNKWQKTPSSECDTDAMERLLGTFKSVPANDPDQWVHQLYKGNPLNIGLKVPREWIDTKYKKRFYYEKNPNTSGNHAMVIVGYWSHYPLDGKGVKAFKLRNSWDKDWGENGYIWVKAETLQGLLIADPIVLDGWDKRATYKIIGKVVPDFEKAINKTPTGADMYNDSNLTWSNPPDFRVGAFAQFDGNLKQITEQPLRDPEGKFELGFNIDLSTIEKPTRLSEYYSQQFNDVDFDQMGSGIVVYAQIKDQYWFHIVKFTYSEAGRGGEGRNDPKNPCSSRNDCSGVPIVLTNDHKVEENVIVPCTTHEPVTIVLEHPQPENGGHVQREVNDQKGLHVGGKVIDKTGSKYDHLYGIYDMHGQLVAKLLNKNNVKANKSTETQVELSNITKPNDETGSLEAGYYTIHMFAKVSNGDLTLPQDLNNVPESLYHANPIPLEITGKDDTHSPVNKVTELLRELSKNLENEEHYEDNFIQKLTEECNRLRNIHGTFPLKKAEKEAILHFDQLIKSLKDTHKIKKPFTAPYSETLEAQRKKLENEIKQEFEDLKKNAEDEKKAELEKYIKMVDTMLSDLDKIEGGIQKKDNLEGQIGRIKETLKQKDPNQALSEVMNTIQNIISYDNQIGKGLAQIQEVINKLEQGFKTLNKSN